MSTAEPVSVTALCDFLKQKYVQRADERQKSMGLSYMEAETADLASNVVRFLSAFSHEPVAWEHFDNKGSKELSYHPATEYMTRIGYQSRPLAALSHVPPEPVRQDGGCLYCDADQGEQHRSNCTKPKRRPAPEWVEKEIQAYRTVQAPAEPFGWVVRVAGGYNFYTDGGVANAKAHFLREVARAVYTSPTPQVDEAMVERGKLLRHFVSMFKSGAQGCEMDWEGAQALALAIEAAIGAKP